MELHHLPEDRTRTHHVKQSKAHKRCMLSLPWSLALKEWVSMKHKETTEAEEEIERGRRWGMRKGNRVRKTFHIFYCKNPESLPRRHTYTHAHTPCVKGKGKQKWEGKGVLEEGGQWSGGCQQDTDAHGNTTRSSLLCTNWRGGETTPGLLGFTFPKMQPSRSRHVIQSSDVPGCLVTL